MRLKRGELVQRGEEEKLEGKADNPGVSGGRRGAGLEGEGAGAGEGGEEIGG